MPLQRAIMQGNIDAYGRYKFSTICYKMQYFWHLKINTKICVFCFLRTNNPKNLTISFGTEVSPPYMQHYVQEVIIHENYVKGDHHDDIAVIVLTERVLFKNDVHRVCLPEATQVFPPGEGVVVTGWGALLHSGESNGSTQRKTQGQCEHAAI